jgi:hypothetical protein
MLLRPLGVKMAPLGVCTPHAEISPVCTTDPECFDAAVGVGVGGNDAEGVTL